MDCCLLEGPSCLYQSKTDTGEAHLRFCIGPAACVRNLQPLYAEHMDYQMQLMTAFSHLRTSFVVFLPSFSPGSIREIPSHQVIAHDGENSDIRKAVLFNKKYGLSISEHLQLDVYLQVRILIFMQEMECLILTRVRKIVYYAVEKI